MVVFLVRSTSLYSSVLLPAYLWCPDFNVSLRVAPTRHCTTVANFASVVLLCLVPGLTAELLLWPLYLLLYSDVKMARSCQGGENGNSIARRWRQYRCHVKLTCLELQRSNSIHILPVSSSWTTARRAVSIRGSPCEQNRFIIIPIYNPQRSNNRYFPPPWHDRTESRQRNSRSTPSSQNKRRMIQVKNQQLATLSRIQY